MHKKRQTNKRRYQRLATAIAGAAIMSTALLPGIPAAIAHAAPARHVMARPGAGNRIQQLSPTGADTATPAPTVTADTSVTPPAPTVTADTNVTAPTPAPTPTPTPTPVPAPAPSTVTTNTSNVATNDPVQTVIANAGSYGLDTNGRYSVISQTDNRTVVRVRSNGQTYKVDLVLRDGNWVIKAIRGIGDANNPATYVTANSLNSTLLTNVANQVPGTVVATLGASQQVIYQNNNYDNWSWNQSAYPQDMAFGVLTQSPQTTGIATPLPANLVNSINNINFNNRLVVYAHLGTTPAQGYGIGISRIEQNGNDLIVTVRTNNPQSGVALGSTQSDSYVGIDRSMLNMSAPIHVNFVDQNGTAVGSYTANAG